MSGKSAGGTVSFALSVSLIACSGEGEHAGNRSQAIINGKVLAAADAAKSAAVRVEALGGSSSGFLLASRNRVGTTLHSFCGGLKDASVAKHEGPALGIRRHSVTAVQIPSESKCSYDVSRKDFVVDGPDFAIASLGGKFGSPGAVVACATPAVSQLRCVSSFLQTAAEDSYGAIKAVEGIVFNEAAFDVIREFDAPAANSANAPNVVRLKVIDYRATPSRPPALDTTPKATWPGDSGMGCYAGDQVYGVHTRGGSVIRANAVPPRAPRISRTVSTGYRLDAFCPLMFAGGKFSAHDQEFASNEIVPRLRDYLDSDETLDDGALWHVGGTNYVLQLRRSLVGEIPLPVTVPDGPPLGSQMVVGNFDGRGEALAILRGGQLATLSVNKGPVPSVESSESEYFMLSGADINGDRFDDLVVTPVGARRQDVYVGSSSGLKRRPDLDPMPITLDRDGIADLVWAEGTELHFFSSRGGKHKDPLPNGIRPTQIAQGRFRWRAQGIQSGVDDVALVGSGMVVWCPSTLFGLRCTPALDAPFISQRTATSILVEDLDGDALEDITVSYADLGPTKVFVASEDGFDVNFGNGVDLLAGVQIGSETPASVTLKSIQNRLTIQVRINALTPEVLPPVATNIPYIQPVTLLVGNFNGDSSDPAGATAGSAQIAPGFPIEDLAILSGGKVYALISNGDGTFTTNTLDGATGITKIEVTDVNGDGLDDLEATKSDGSVTVYSGVAGSGEGL